MLFSLIRKDRKRFSLRLFTLTVISIGLPTWGFADSLPGTVFHDDGRPAAGATVFAAALFHTPPLRVQTVADENGQFELVLPRLSGGEYYSLAARDRFEGADVWNVNDANGKKVSIKGQPLPPVSIRLRPVGTLRGRLLQEEDGQPIANAELYLDTGDVLRTNANGEFFLGGLALRDHSLIPVAAGRVRKHVLFDTTLRPAAELEIRLPRGASLRGQIVDEQGMPVTGACLTRAGSGSALTLNGWDQPVYSDGTFEYDGFLSPELDYELEVSAPGYRTTSVNVRFSDLEEVIEKTVVMQADRRPLSKRTNEVTFPENTQTSTQKLPRREVEGIIHDPKGDPVADAEVRWGAFLWDSSVKSVKSNSEGRFTLGNVPASEGAILVLAKGYAPQFVPLSKTPERMPITLSSGERYHGRIINSQGEPVAGVRVIPITRCPESGICNPIWFTDLAVSSDAEGRFEISSLMPTGVSFDFLHSAYSDHRDVPLPPNTDNEVRLTAGGAIQGKVIAMSGQPVRNFNVRVTIPLEYTRDEQVGGYFAGYGWYGVDFTRDDGIFTLSGLVAGSWSKLIVSAPGKGMAVIDRIQSQPLDQISSPENFIIRLEPHRPLNIKVVAQETGEPVEQALVGLVKDERFTDQKFGWGIDDRSARRLHTSSQGALQFSEPNCSSGTIFVSAKGYARVHLPWDGNSRLLTISLQPEARLTGEVLIGDKLLHDGFVRVTSHTNDYTGANLAQTQGTFDFSQLAAGECRIEVLGSNGETLSEQTVTLKPGEHQKLQITISLR